MILDSNKTIITRLYQVSMLISFIAIFTHYPESQQVIKYINYFAILLILFSIKYFFVDINYVFNRHFNQFFFINVVYLIKIYLDLWNSIEFFSPTRGINENFAKVWIVFTHDYFINTVILAIFLALIFIYIIISADSIKVVKNVLIKMGALIVFFCLTIYFQNRISYIFENIF